eukprot:scaffold1891_cov59-Phaeocystis_antarctica.AAC.2
MSVSMREDCIKSISAFAPLSLVVAFTSAPCSSSTLTCSASPLEHATCSAVEPDSVRALVSALLSSSARISSGWATRLAAETGPFGFFLHIIAAEEARRGIVLPAPFCWQSGVGKAWARSKSRRRMRLHTHCIALCIALPSPCLEFSRPHTSCGRTGELAVTGEPAASSPPRAPPASSGSTFASLSPSMLPLSQSAVAYRPLVRSNSRMVAEAPLSWGLACRPRTVTRVPGSSKGCGESNSGAASRRTTPPCPLLRAMSPGVSPSLATTRASAPTDKSSRATASWPPTHAEPRGVQPEQKGASTFARACTSSRQISRCPSCAALKSGVGVSIVVEEEARIGVLAVLTCHHQLRAPVGCAAVLVRVDARLDDQVGRIQVKRAAGGAREGKARVEGRGREGVAARVLDPHAWVGTRFEQQSNAISRAALNRNQEQRQLGHRRRCLLAVDPELHLKVVSGVRRHALQQAS